MNWSNVSNATAMVYKRHVPGSCALAALAGMLISLNIGCSSGTPAEKTLGTTGERNREAHAIVTDINSHVLNYKGFVVGVEKAKRETVGGASLDGLEPKNDADLSHAVQNRAECQLSDPKCMFVSHIAGYRPGQPPRYLYNAYAEDQIGCAKEAFRNGVASLDVLRTDIAGAIDEGEGTTHIIIYTSGWFNSQAETIDGANQVVASLARQAPADRPFRPLVIGLSWPSLWTFWGRTSYFTKANDADEVGMAFMSRLLYRAVLPARDASAKKPKVVVLGHSFGARVALWGLFGKGLLAGDGSSLANTAPDLIVALQGAFPLARFKNEGGLEGNPFAKLPDGVGLVAATCSSHDGALPFALWTKDLGLVRSVSEAAVYPDQFDSTKVICEAKSLRLSPPLSSATVAKGHVLIVDATPIICSHNDVRNQQVGWLIWQLLQH